MRTIDLPVGSHVAYDQNEARNYHSFLEAYVMVHRSKGDQYSYWGKNGNNNTVGIAYTTKRYKDSAGRPVWQFTWVRPGTIHMLWKEHQRIVAKAAADTAERTRCHEEEVAIRKTRLKDIPETILKAFNLQVYQREYLISRGECSIYLTLDKIEAVINAARITDPETTPARIQGEVESALALLN